MSFEVEDIDHNKLVEDQNKEMIKLLKAILMGIEFISGNENLIDNVEE